MIEEDVDFDDRPDILEAMRVGPLAAVSELGLRLW